MKKIKEFRSPGMPLLEIMIVIGMFSVISVFILQLFLSADTMKEKARDTSKAVILAENAAEAVKGSASFEEAAVRIGIKKEREADAWYAAYYDSDWKPAEEKDIYCLAVVPSMTAEAAGTTIYADIYVYRLKGYLFDSGAQRELCHLTTVRYEPGR